MRTLLARFTVATTLGLAACATTEPPPPVPPVNPALAIDADPMALFPPGAAIVAEVDAHTFYASGSLGGQLASLTEAAMPLGQEIGFVATRDVDRAFVAGYVGATTDVVGILSGRFDLAHMQAAAAAHAPGRSGNPWTVAPYAGRTLYATGGSFAFAPITDHTLAAGSESAVRRVLDRLALPGPRPEGPRALPDWMQRTLETPGSAFSLAADVGSVPPQAMHGWSLPGAMSGLSRLAVVGDFHPPGVNVAATLTYADPPHATSGAASLQQIASIATVAGQLGAGPKVQNLSIVPDGTSVSCKFVLDEESLKRSLASVMPFLTPTAPHPSG